MDRRSLSLRWPAIFTALVLAAVAATGCTVLQTAAILWQGYELPPEFDGLKDKKVAIVCKMVASEDFSSPGTARDSL